MAGIIQMPCRLATKVLESYLADGQMSAELMSSGNAWLDTEIHVRLQDAGNFVRTLSDRQSQQIVSPDAIAHAQGWIDDDALRARAEMFGKNGYGTLLMLVE